MRNKTNNILKAKPIKIWEIREYSKGSLLENGIVLNKTATFIYKLCDGKKTVEVIAKIILENYKVNFQKSKTDTINCIKELMATDSIKLQ